MIGQIVGNYKIETKLGEGGMGAVYKGVDTMLDREVAIKALKPELASQTSIVERFRSEAVTLAKLNHPNIAALYTMFRQGEELYMVLEFVRGETLDTIIQKRGALPAEEAIPVFCQVLDGIDHAHELGIVHRDIKPANIMLTENGKLKVLDFGIARLLGSARMTRAGNIIGTLEYMAPEQVKGQETDARSDIYALGMMLYEVLTGKTPFDTENEFELMKLQTESTPRSPREINPNIPEAVEAAIMRSIEKDPEERFQTAGEFRETLLDAGFAASGAMRGVTGNFAAKGNTHPSKPALSQPGNTSAKSKDAPKATRLGAPSAPTESKASAKATRLGASAATASASANSAKATRLGMTNTAAVSENAPQSNEAAPSFFSQLTMVHYAGAGIAAVVLLGILVAVPLMLMSGKGKTDEAEAAAGTTKPAEKPAIVEAPKTEQPAISTAAPPQSTTTTAPPVNESAGTLVPADSQTGDLTLQPDVKAVKPTGKSADKPRETAAQRPAAPKPAAPKKPAVKKPNLDDILSGN
ncbi:MAG TPA: serine/threonine-protein kinase [Pyrinomonadaceae bacterium]|nr:serine/threonine-protein kinase [Pyrinomonadaceae bacterium]